MADKSQKLTKLILAGAGAALGIFLIAKYHKNIIQKMCKAKNKIIYNFANVRKSKFQVEIINSPSECQSILANLKTHCKDYPVLGFDCEWVSVNSERRKVAMIQLCTEQGLCALFRICKFGKIPIELKEILEDPEIIKAGVTPASDAQYLLQDYAIQTNGTFDLRFLALIAKQKAEGLAKLSKSVLDVELDKDWHVRCSDWEIEQLSRRQINYAAMDAFVAIEIFRKLYISIRQSEVNPQAIRRFCDNYTDISFKNKLAQMNLDPADDDSTSRRLLKGQKTMKDLKRSYTARKSQLYDNCHLQAPDGELLCYCDRKKAERYLEKGLAVEIHDVPVYTVRLNFEPAGRAVGEVGEFYRTVKENLCVVCGKTDDLIRKNVVPHEYRKFFPNVMKDKTSHDVLLLCIHCHQRSNMYDHTLRQMLQDKFDAPLNGEIPTKEVEAAKKLCKDQRMANALLFSKQQIPEKRREELKLQLEKSFPGQDITHEFLRNLLSLQKVKLGELAASHGETVVKRYRETEGLVQLEKRWRQHFLDNMQPKYMPQLWSINHNSNRLQIRATEGRVEAKDLKDAGVDAEIKPKAERAMIAVKETLLESANNEGDDTTSSDWDFRSAAGSRNSKVDPDRTLTEDEHYYSDGASGRSFYETIRSEGSTLDDFQSFASSLTECQPHDSDGSQSSLFSQDLSIDSDTEVEEEQMQMGKMEL